MATTAQRLTDLERRVALLEKPVPVPVPVPTPTPAPPPTALGRWGAFVHMFPETQAPQDAFVAATGPLSIVHWFVAWSGWTGGGNKSGYNWSDVAPTIAAVHAKGQTPMITWEAWGAPDRNPNFTTIDFPLADIAAGKFDAYIDSWAKGAATLTKPLLITLFHEMNFPYSTQWQTGYPWSLSNNTPLWYVAAWRHIVDRFRLAGATQVKFVFQPGGNVAGNPDYLRAYPGDAYVDYSGWHAYEDTNVPNAFADDLARIKALTPTKPLIIGECSGSAAWVTKYLAPFVRAGGTAVWFESSGFTVAERGAGAAVKAMLA